jgi:amidase
LVDNLKIANLAEYYSSSSENTAWLAEFKIALNAYLSELVSSPIRSLADAIAFNKKNPKLASLYNEHHALCILALLCVCPLVIDITKTQW